MADKLNDSRKTEDFLLKEQQKSVKTGFCSINTVLIGTLVIEK